MAEAQPSVSAAQQLQPLDASLVAILLDATVERLEFLHNTLPKVSVSGGVSVQRDELTRFVGEQIGAVIQEQRALEDEYDRLMEDRKRLMLEGPQRKQELQAVNKQVEEIKSRLRGSNATLTRSLKENPNVRDNQQKLLNERIALMSVVAECGRAVKTTGNYGQLVERIKQEETELNKLATVKSRLSTLEEEIVLLEREIRDEKTKMKNQESTYLSEYKEVKEELDKHRISADIELEYYEKRLQTERETLGLALQMQQNMLDERNRKVKEQISGEQIVHEQTKLFFQKTIDALTADKALWTDRVEVQAKHLEEQVLPDLKTRRQQVLSELERLRSRKDRDDREKLQEAEDHKLGKEAVTRRVASLEELDKAVMLLQSVSRRFLATKDSGKKKKKKGGKKKK